MLDRGNTSRIILLLPVFLIFKRFNTILKNKVLPIPDPPKKMEIISALSVLFLSKTSEMYSVNPL